MANLNYYKSKIKRFTLTDWLIAANLVMFLLTELIDFFFTRYISTSALILLSAKVNALIALGEYWRLLSAMFLHANFLHVTFNMLALHIIGRDIERFYGKKKFLAIYFISGLVGSGFSYLFISGVSVGASGAIFGLMGANLYLYKVNPNVYKRIYGTDFIMLIGINLLIGFIGPNIDIAGHIGGLIAGFTTAWALGLTHESSTDVKRIPFQAITLLLLIIPIVFGTLNQTSTPNLYLSGAYYYYSTGNETKALATVDKGLKKFPDNTDLQSLQSQLNAQ